MAEAVTDVDVGSFSGTVPAPPLAWVDQTTGNEIADFCNQIQAQITVNSNTYTVQQVFSNMQQACVSAPGHFDFFSQITNVVPGAPFQVTVTAASSVFDQALHGYNNTVHFTSSDGAAALPADYTYVASDNGVHTFNVTLNTTGSQTVSVNDTVVTAMNSSFTMDVEHNPDLTGASSHGGNFRQGDIGDTYTITATNSGDLATNGSTVSVFIGFSGTLPFGLTATALSGSGWSCVLASLTCTTTATVAAHTSYPAITLTVNVANNAPASLTLSGAVSGGGELNTSNDSFSDPTTIVQFPDLQIAKRHLGSFAQGQIGATYSLLVTNVGFAPTSGQVTVTDILPTGLTATAIGSPGWSCSTPPTLTCTRNDSLNQSTDYPTITLTVNVDPAAPMPSVTNTANVSGGGEVNIANDSASDVTPITAAASDMIVVGTHAGNFTQGQIGATYILTASNIGPLATSGPVTVTDSLPTVFTLTAMSGPGWSCNTSSVPPSCTRSDVLPADTAGTPSSYPPITVTVNVAANATGPVSNFVLVAGGGELNTINDESSDITAINGVPDFAAFISHTGDFPAGGSGTYLLQVENFGQGASSGSVTVVDNLPAGFTAVSISGPGWSCTVSTVTCTRSDSLGVNLAYPLISLTVNLAANLSEGLVTNTDTVTGVGDVNSSNNTGFDQTEVLVPLSFPGARSAATVKAGGSVVYGLLVSAGATGTINFACSNLPPASTCQFRVNPINVLQPALLNESFTVTTTAPPTSSFRSSAKKRPEPPLSAFSAGLIGLLAAMVLVCRRPKAGRTRLALLAGSLVVMLFLVAPGCGGGHGGGGGGGGGNNPPPPAFTPPGLYTITIQATNGNLQATTSVDLTVQ